MIPKELTELNQWVCVLNKVPYDPKEVEKTAKVNDPTTWGSYEQSVNNENFEQVGFVFNNNGIVGIDIDTGVDNKGLLNEWCCDLISRCHSYTEFSQNGRGVHIFLKATLPNGTSGMVNNDHTHKIELTQSCRHFVMTDDVLLDNDIEENQEAIDYIIATYFGEEKTFKEPFYKAIYQTNGKKIPLAPTYPNIPQGSRNQSLLSYGGHLLAQGLTDREVYTELLKLNSTKCKPPLERNEVDLIFRSVMKYATGNRNG